MVADKNRLRGLKAKLTRLKRDADVLAQRHVFIDRAPIRETEHQIAMLEQK